MLTVVTHCLANSHDFCVHHNWIFDIKKNTSVLKNFLASKLNKTTSLFGTHTFESGFPSMVGNFSRPRAKTWKMTKILLTPLRMGDFKALSDGR